MVAEARKLSDSLRNEEEKQDGTKEELAQILQSLDALGYDEAAQYVYGMNYGDWKKRHAKKASDEQMQKFNDSKPMWATHDKQLLAKRADEPAAKIAVSSNTTTSAAPASSLLSNVCCQDVDSPPQPTPASTTTKKSKTRELPPYQSPAPPKVSFSLGILTVSDRASSGEYETGDLSGPAVKEAVAKEVAGYGDTVVSQTKIETAIVPDDMEAIQSQLKDWADNSKLDLILTTGGTGFSPRDVTPEATSAVVERTCGGLVSFCTMECAKLQPLASLSRGTAGTRGKTLILNLPGNPKGVQGIIPVLLPLALHAVADMASSS